MPVTGSCYSVLGSRLRTIYKINTGQGANARLWPPGNRTPAAPLRLSGIGSYTPVLCPGPSGILEVMPMTLQVGQVPSIYFPNLVRLQVPLGQLGGFSEPGLFLRLLTTSLVSGVAVVLHSGPVSGTPVLQWFQISALRSRLHVVRLGVWRSSRTPGSHPRPERATAWCHQHYG